MISDADKKIIAEFKSLKTTDFATLPNVKKFQYLDVLSNKLQSPQEYAQTFDGVYDNLRACLFSIKPDKHFLLTEKQKVNRFINGLVGWGLDKVIKSADVRSEMQKKDDINKFINSFCEVYKVTKPEVIFKNDENSTCSTKNDGSGIRLRHDFLQKNMNWYDYESIFHEMIHVYQKHLYAEDSKEYKMFSPQYELLKFGTYMANKKDEVKIRDSKVNEIYALLPSETHAYWISHEFSALFNEKTFKRPYKCNLGYCGSRALWFGRDL